MPGKAFGKENDDGGFATNFDGREGEAMIQYAEPTEKDLERLRQWWERIKKIFGTSTKIMLDKEMLKR